MKSNTKYTLNIYYQHTRKYAFLAIVIILGIIGASVLNAIIPLFFKNFFDIIAGDASQQQKYSELIGIVGLIAVAEFFNWLFWRINTFANAYVQSRVMTDLANSCFAYLHKHSFTFFNNNFVGSLVKKVKWFSKSYENIVDRFIFDLLPLAVNIVVIAVVLFSRNVWLGLVVLVWIIVFLAINYFFTRYKLKYDIVKSKAETEATGYLADTITNNSVIKLFTGYSREIIGFGKVNERLSKSRLFAWNLGNIFEAIQGVLMLGLEVGALYFALQLWLDGLLTIGDFVLIQSYLLIIFIRVFNFGNVLRGMYESLADAEEMTEILRLPHEIIDVHSASELKVTEGRIEFKDVDFAYNQTRKIFDKFNLTIDPRQSIALIGPSGAGKSTIVKLLLRMHDLSGGKILIDGQKINQVTQESLWSNISMVPQDPILFHRPLIENIRYGKPSATDAEVIDAAKKAHCHEFIQNLSEGYQTYVGERGIKLSGGERQRVAIARAILADTPILVMDEATSSLDSESEKLIQDALQYLMKNKTVLVIAHRLSTVRQADRIIVIDGGRVVEDGNHEALLAKSNGLYKKLWTMQAGGFLE